MNVSAAASIDRNAPPQGGAFVCGIVEGFFGKPWSMDTRRAYTAFMRAEGFGRYIYAPKDDAWLRKHWDQPFPPAHAAALQELCAHYHNEGLSFGMGLSPFELYRDFSRDARARLLAKLEAINAIGPDTLCLLFDDMRGDVPGIAQYQLDIMKLVREHSSARTFLLCPTYYSSDPRLERLFGTPPDHYLEAIGAGLPQDVGIFWTGPSIISSHYPTEHLDSIAAILQRKPVLWDNYPVNDAERLTHFLHLRPAARGAELRVHSGGLYANPMNQGWLSQLPLYALARQLCGDERTAEQLFAAACAALCEPALARALVADVGHFQDLGLQQLEPDTRAALLARYQGFAPSPLAAEIVAWLEGHYRFDPACLT